MSVVAPGNIPALTASAMGAGAVAALALRKGSGKSSTTTSGPGQRVTARSMTLRSSRMLPGQWYSCYAANACADSPRTSGRFRAANSARNFKANGAIDARRSRNGGR